MRIHPFPHFSSFAAPLALMAVAGVIAAAVDRFVPSANLAGITRPANEFGNPAIRTGTGAYPRQAIDSDGFTVRIPHPARRIVSQYWSLDEYLYSVLPPERVVAVSAAAYDPSFSNVNRQVQQFHPAVASDVETVLRLNPDLVLVSNSAEADFCALMRSTGVPLYRAYTNFTSLQQVAETIRLIGYLTGDDAGAEQSLARFRAAVAKARSVRPPNAPRPRILGFEGGYCNGSGTLFDDMVKTLGGVNVATEGGLKGSDSVNTEQIIRWNPEWIVTGANRGESKKTLARLLTDPGIALTQAARNGHILVFENNVYQPMSPFSTLLMSGMAEAIYGQGR
jgi:iron complex transport system substrate-binding protein